MYKDTSSLQLAEMALEEANKIEKKAHEAMMRLGGPDQSAHAVSFFFLTDFKDCCLAEVEYLRAAILERLGQAAHDTDEIRAFSGPGGLVDVGNNPDGAIPTVQQYAPHFRKLAIELKRKSSPSAGPTELSFSETRTVAKLPEFPYCLLVTIATPRVATSGYVVVQLDSKIAGMQSDFEDSKLAFESDVSDNEELAKLLAWNSPITVYALRIGKTPLRTGTPIHVVAFARTEFHVSKVQLFDE
jgi:hypothetical protein